MTIIRSFCSLLFLCILVSSNTNLKTLLRNLNGNELIIFMDEENDYFFGELIDEVNSHFDHIVRGNNSGFHLLEFLSENSILLFYDVKPSTVSTLITKAQCSKIREKCKFRKSYVFFVSKAKNQYFVHLSIQQFYSAPFSNFRTLLYKATPSQLRYNLWIVIGKISKRNSYFSKDAKTETGTIKRYSIRSQIYFVNLENSELTLVLGQGSNKFRYKVFLKLILAQM